MGKTLNKILVIRMSALGDVAMVIPVLYPICYSYPDKEFVLITSPLASQLYIDRPKNLKVKPVDTKKNFKGLKGIFSLFRELKNEKFDAIADLHDVLRSKVLSFMFKLGGTKVATIDKGRKEKRKITSENREVFEQLKTSFERYSDVFKELGLISSQEFTPLKSSSMLPDWLQRSETDTTKWVGVAPFSKHEGKNYPLDKMKQVVDELAETGQYKIFLFGSPVDGVELDKWQVNDGKIVSLCNSKLGLEKEMALMSQLSVVVSMDSANMHIAALMKTPVISIWGATHSYTGFLGWGLGEGSIIERKDLKCRPCSVFGNKPCRYGSYPCMEINPREVVSRVKKLTEGR